MRLNLGCGDRRMDGYVNIDLRPGVADVAADAAVLSFAADRTVDEIVALDLLEHFPQVRTQAVLAEWHRVLIDGGRLTVKVPNLHAICVQIAAGVQVDMLIRNIYGGHRWGPGGAYDTHHTGWTPDLLAAELAKAGFEVLHNDLGLNMRVVARKKAAA